MTHRPTPIPHKMPSAPQDYDQRFFNQFNRQLERILNDLNQPELAKSGGLFLDVQSLPSSGTGLRPGFVYRDGDYLRVIIEGSSHLSSFLTPVFLGTLTVTTT